MRFWIIHAVFSVSIKNRNGVFFLQGSIKITKNKEARFIFLEVACEILQKIKDKLSYPQITFSITFG